MVCPGILAIRVTPDIMRADNRPVEATGSERARYEYGVTDKPWTRLQLIYNGTGRSSCDNRDILLYYRENSRTP